MESSRSKELVYKKLQQDYVDNGLDYRNPGFSMDGGSREESKRRLVHLFKIRDSALMQQKIMSIKHLNARESQRSLANEEELKD